MGRNVLIVDDSPDVCTLLSVVFRNSFGCDVTAVQNVSRAVTLIQTVQSDLVVTDLQMPLGGGTAVAKALMKFQPGTPLIFFSSVDLANEVRVGNTSFPFIQKPEVRELLGAVASVSGWSIEWPRAYQATEGRQFPIT